MLPSRQVSRTPSTPTTTNETESPPQATKEIHQEPQEPLSRCTTCLLLTASGGWCRCHDTARKPNKPPASAEKARWRKLRSLNYWLFGLLFFWASHVPVALAGHCDSTLHMHLQLRGRGNLLHTYWYLIRILELASNLCLINSHLCCPR